MSDRIDKDLIASAQEEVIQTPSKEEAVDDKISEEARKEAEALAREIEKAEKAAKKEAEKEAKEAEKEAEKKAEKEAKEAEKEAKEAEKEAKEAEKEAKEAEKEAEKEREKAEEKERKEEDSEDAPKEKKNRYEYFFKRFEIFNRRSRTDELESKYKTSDDVVLGVVKAKLGFWESERYFTRLAEYKISRLVYEYYFEKYQFGRDRVTAQIVDEKNERHIYEVRSRAFKARVSEFFDNIRYRIALNLTAERKTLRTIARPAIIDRNKVVLLALLERKREINKELLELYVERNKEYLKAESRNSELNIGLRARKRAYYNLLDLERKLPLYAFTAAEKTQVYEYMNSIIELSSDLALLRHRKDRIVKEDRVAKDDRGDLHDAISAKKEEIEKVENDMDMLISKARRRTSLDGKRYVWRWVVGVAIVSIILIVLVSIFSEPLTEFFLNWAMETR